MTATSAALLYLLIEIDSRLRAKRKGSASGAAAASERRIRPIAASAPAEPPPGRTCFCYEKGWRPTFHPRIPAATPFEKFLVANGPIATSTLAHACMHARRDPSPDPIRGESMVRLRKGEIVPTAGQVDVISRALTSLLGRHVMWSELFDEVRP